ncbi:MAG: C69 family dipeptidase [Candidatus Aminicenantes bacterium]|nr:C69 family dipeptidase [Candidatus Aminicenantes bacterium]
MKKAAIFSIFLLMTALPFLGDEEGCTTITVGKKASSSGFVTTSHTCDSHRTGSAITVQPRARHKPGEKTSVHIRENDDSGPMPQYKRVKIGEIPQVPLTYQYINTAYASMNEYQLAIGESTFGGREELRSDEGLIDCQELCRLMLERCKTAREALNLAGELTKKFGYNDGGECLTIADKNEVWHLEILGPGKGKTGSIWAAQRVPDNHVSVCANGSRIREINLKQPDYFLASENVFSAAVENGWWDPKSGIPFEFCYAYSPESRTSFATRRREWRVLSLIAPSLKLHPNSENYPFSVKPDQSVTLEQLIDIFGDTFEGTDFDMTKNIVAPDNDGKMIKSPFANPFMPYDMNPLFKINGGWGWRGERPIARLYCMYAIITQSRSDMPDPVGGVVWLSYDNPATTVWVPFYASVQRMPESYTVEGRNGYSRKSAWWAYNRASTLAAQRWGDMRKDVEKIRKTLQTEALGKQKEIEAKALELYKSSPEKAASFLTKYSIDFAAKAAEAFWKLGDFLWTKYDEKF